MERYKLAMPDRMFGLDRSKLVIVDCMFAIIRICDVWFNPRYRIVTKLIVTIVVIAVTICAFYFTANMYTRLTEPIKALGIN